MLLSNLCDGDINLIMKCKKFPLNYLPKSFKVMSDNCFKYKLSEDIYCSETENYYLKIKFEIIFYLEINCVICELYLCGNEIMCFEYNNTKYIVNLMTIYNIIYDCFDKSVNYYKLDSIYPIDSIKLLSSAYNNIKTLDTDERTAIKNIYLSGPHIFPNIKDCLTRYYDDDKKLIRFYEFSIKTLNNDCYYYLTYRNALLFGNN